MWRIASFRIVWLFLALLAAFVIFVECIAEVGGRAEPLSRPTETPAPASRDIGVFPWWQND